MQEPREPGRMSASERVVRWGCKSTKRRDCTPDRPETPRLRGFKERSRRLRELENAEDDGGVGVGEKRDRDAFADGIELDIPFAVSAGSVYRLWCWAACTLMVVKGYRVGEDYPDDSCIIVDQLPAVIQDRVECCSQSRDSRCERSGGFNVVRSILQKFAIGSGAVQTIQAGEAGRNQVLHQLFKNRSPVLAGIDRSDSNVGHMIVVIGYDTRQSLFIINDPAVGASGNKSWERAAELWRRHLERPGRRLRQPVAASWLRFTIGPVFVAAGSFPFQRT